MKSGSTRISTDDQTTQPQIDYLLEADCERIYTESASGKSKARPELSAMMNALRAGDVVVVQRLDRLCRSLKDLIELLDQFK